MITIDICMIFFTFSFHCTVYWSSVCNSGTCKHPLVRSRTAVIGVINTQFTTSNVVMLLLYWFVYLTPLHLLLSVNYHVDVKLYQIYTVFKKTMSKKKKIQHEVF